jgi:CheY-like chemotaxis protein
MNEIPHRDAAHECRLLVVDDDNVHRMVIGKVGVRAGFAVTGAASFEEAAALVRANRYDCVTLDLSLGAHAGVELLQVLADTCSMAPIIVISGTDRQVCDHALRTGKLLDLDIRAPFSKPVDLPTLRQSLTQIRQRALAPAGPVP